MDLILISLTFGMDLSLTLPTIASTRARLPEHDVERLDIGLPAAFTDAMPIHLVRPVGGTPGHGQATEATPCEVHLQRTVHLRAVLISLVLDDRSTAETMPNL